MSFTVQHKRSSIQDRRPNPADLVDGQVAINLANESPGLFFRTATGNLIKSGPPILSATEPVEGSLVNYQEFSVGELWINTTTSVANYWDGSQWVAFERLRDADFDPAADCTYDLGSPQLRWRNVYTCDVVMSNEGGGNEVDGTWGSYVMQEGEEDLFLINKRNGKKYKFMLQEVKESD